MARRLVAAGLVAGVGALGTLAAPGQAQARVNERLSTMGATCGKIQDQWDLLQERISKKGYVSGQDQQDAVDLVRRWYQEYPDGRSCKSIFGTIYLKAHWSENASLWGVRAHEADHVVSGDFTGDGKTDVLTFSRGDGWPSAAANGLQRYDLYMAAAPFNHSTPGFGVSEVTDPALHEFRAWAAADQHLRSQLNPPRGAVVVAGDFNGDGRDDLAVTGGRNHDRVPVAFSGGITSGFTVAAAPFAGDFPARAADRTAEVVVGDFDGDGKADLAALGGVGQSGIAVARSLGTGAFENLNHQPGGQFAAWAADPAVKVLTGDFNGDGRDDLMLYGKACWDVPGAGCQNAAVPVAFATATGFSTTLHPTNAYFLNQWGVHDVVKPAVGDFNADGVDDVFMFTMRKHPTQPNLFLDDVLIVAVNGDQTFGYDQVVIPTRQVVLPKLIRPGARPLVGDFDEDGHQDLGIVGEFDGGATLGVSYYDGNSQPAHYSEIPVTSPRAPGYGERVPTEPDDPGDEPDDPGGCIRNCP